MADKRHLTVREFRAKLKDHMKFMQDGGDIIIGDFVYSGRSKLISGIENILALKKDDHTDRINVKNVEVFNGFSINDTGEIITDGNIDPDSVFTEEMAVEMILNGDTEICSEILHPCELCNRESNWQFWEEGEEHVICDPCARGKMGKMYKLFIKGKKRL